MALLDRATYPVIEARRRGLDRQGQTRWAAARVLEVRPDLSLFGKVIGGGLPVGAYGGRRDLMEQIAPSGPVYQAGTLSGSPPAMAAGIAALDVLRENPALYDRLERLGKRLETGFKTVSAEAGTACAVVACPVRLWAKNVAS